MKMGVIIYSNDPETVWNAFRFGNFCQAWGDDATIFLLGKVGECKALDTDTFKVNEQLQTFIDADGKVFACGTCLEMHQLQAPEAFTVATMKDMYEIVKESDRVITF